MKTDLRTVCLAFGCAILLYKLVGVARGRRDRATVVFCLYVGLSALSYLVLVPPIAARLDGWTGVPQTAGLLSGVCVLGLTAAQQYLLVHWTYSPELARHKMRRRCSCWVLALVAYVGTYLVFTPGNQRFQYFYLENAHKLWQAPYLVIYALACVVGQADVVHHCRRFAKIADRFWLRCGMLTMAAGGVLILMYGTIRVVDLVAAPMGLDLRALEPVAWTLGDAGALLELLGWVVPVLGPRLSATKRWLRDYRTYRRLYPLWRTLHQQVPEVALRPSRTWLGDVLRLRDVSFWLHRRIIEVHDALRALRLRTDDRSSEGVPAVIAGAVARAGDDGPPMAARDRGPDDDVTWLIELADEVAAYRRGWRRSGSSAEYPVGISRRDARS
ncbi:MAB_1171c family putative transporter [Amycolatopsis sp. cmx-4-61]|uniref:MAB_1171c family putative transporter n=1 Tax=Amycolatopsis sp. cmx-4-61 TaxID=2790937 RepID=UPI00397B3A90